jgi:hypothetical protein
MNYEGFLRVHWVVYVHDNNLHLPKKVSFCSLKKKKKKKWRLHILV